MNKITEAIDSLKEIRTTMKNIKKELRTCCQDEKIIKFLVEGNRIAKKIDFCIVDLTVDFIKSCTAANNCHLNSQ